MSFKETLDRARKQAIDIACAYVAQEVSDYEAAEAIYNPEEYEAICSKVHSVWLKYNYPVKDIVEVVMKLIQKDHIAINDLSDDKILKSL